MLNWLKSDKKTIDCACLEGAGRLISFKGIKEDGKANYLFLHAYLCTWLLHDDFFFFSSQLTIQ